LRRDGKARTGAAEVGAEVEKTYCAVVDDNVSYNRVAFALLAKIFPLLFFFGCISHLLSLLSSDICSIAAFAACLAKQKKLVKFVRAHKRVKCLFRSLAGFHEMPRLFSETRFAGAGLMGHSVIENKDQFEGLVDHEKFDEVTDSVRRTTTQSRQERLDEIKDIVNDNEE